MPKYYKKLFDLTFIQTFKGATFSQTQHLTCNVTSAPWLFSENLVISRDAWLVKNVTLGPPTIT